MQFDLSSGKVNEWSYLSTTSCYVGRWIMLSLGIIAVLQYFEAFESPPNRQYCLVVLYFYLISQTRLMGRC